MSTSKNTSFSPYLHNINKTTLWFADENALNLIQQLPNDNGQYSLLHVISNRYDIYQTAINKGISATFNDFVCDSLTQRPERILYHISKEKPLTHHLLNQASKLLAENGELILEGKKQQGIKTYSDKLLKKLGFSGKLKKSGTDYSGCFTRNATLVTQQEWLDDQDYQTIQKLPIKHKSIPFIHSKPGVFGWNKIDKGTQLLLAHLPAILETHPHSVKSLLDLGCGYGWILMNLTEHFSAARLASMRIVATDNNAAAIICAEKNAQYYQSNSKVIAADCADSINEKFDLILCNPPFHQGFNHDKALTDKFLMQTRQHLKPHGIAVWVVNEFIALDVLAKEHSMICKKLIQQSGFSVYQLAAQA